MQVELFVKIGNGPGFCGAHKTIKLDFVPVPGVFYDDATWDDSGGRKIIGVTINYEAPSESQDETPEPSKVSLSVALEPDDSDTRDNLKKEYEAHGWRISGGYE